MNARHDIQHIAPASLASPLVLRCGATARNRFLKAPMNEALAGPEARPTAEHVTLYRRWADSGCGILVTGNVMVDRNQLGEPGNVAVEDERDLPTLRAWAKAGAANGAQLWMQINHPGKQSPATINPHPVAPSATGTSGEYSRFFASPRELSVDEIHAIVRRFATTAAIARKAGFTGVEIHAAHGYLINQFLSPLDNRRADEYGGSLDNRMRFLTEVVEAAREAVGEDFPVAVKINSSDGIDGGFSEEESLKVIARLDAMGVDLIDISGGTMAGKPVIQTNGGAAEDQTRGVYFAGFATKLRALFDDGKEHMAVALTGGFRSAPDMRRALESGMADVVGLGRPLVVAPNFPKQVMAGGFERPLRLPRVSTGVRALDRAFNGVLVISWYESQMHRLAVGKAPKTDGRHLGIMALAFALRKHGPGALAPRRRKGHR
ncbi:NADH:flavin oxidoreductase/NADH oxidase family protein [Bifidobacterium lemurum]|nr:NADH:flavin oxidoreductase/NADH oxidase family protein [Bifidobacterium lemurum]QOL35238.1 NADH:flavin oxidoreductase/NADH oxidase family protein [Bifidobacterium lemurum]